MSDKDADVAEEEDDTQPVIPPYPDKLRVPPPRPSRSAAARPAVPKSRPEVTIISGHPSEGKKRPPLPPSRPVSGPSRPQKPPPPTLRPARPPVDETENENVAQTAKPEESASDGSSRHQSLPTQSKSQHPKAPAKDSDDSATASVPSRPPAPSRISKSPTSDKEESPEPPAKPPPPATRPAPPVSRPAAVRRDTGPSRPKPAVPASPPKRKAAAEVKSSSEHVDEIQSKASNRPVPPKRSTASGLEGTHDKTDKEPVAKPVKPDVPRERPVVPRRATNEHKSDNQELDVTEVTKEAKPRVSPKRPIKSQEGTGSKDDSGNEKAFEEEEDMQTAGQLMQDQMPLDGAKAVVSEAREQETETKVKRPIPPQRTATSKQSAKPGESNEAVQQDVRSKPALPKARPPLPVAKKREKHKEEVDEQRDEARVTTEEEPHQEDAPVRPERAKRPGQTRPPPPKDAPKPSRPGPPSKRSPKLSRPNQSPHVQKLHEKVKSSGHHEEKSHDQEKDSPELPPRPGPGHPLFKYVVSESHGIAIHPYNGSGPDELSFDVDDVVILLNRVDENWLMGRVGENEGMFPQKFIKIVKNLPGWNLPLYPCAVAMFDFDGETEDELTIRAGDEIRLLERVNDEWLKGSIADAVGIFPENCVEILVPLDDPLVARLVAAARTDPHGVALFDFDGENPNELSFKAGNTISLIEKVDSDWLRGRIDLQEGIFPSSFVEIVIDIPKFSYAIVQYDFEGQGDEELTVKAGDRVKVFRHIDKTWIECELNGKVGRCPAPFLLEELVATEPETSSAIESVADVTAGPHCVATFDFDGQDGELSFKTDDVIAITDRVNEEWLNGQLDGRTGMFPVAFVRVVKELD
ncbi:SH3 domain-containing protein 19-like isoform X2 [Corticium candelabrum]|uniref:SH3 domain-containing protein 19-like isoform X2 n=1 Tax=Corticium candelabrum TaxID=121492 RepID=UPI002E271E0F|nr:SH3 domain-containing protein 19-like isoform X2 [Corticium candelabrum]